MTVLIIITVAVFIGAIVKIIREDRIDHSQDIY